MQSFWHYREDGEWIHDSEYGSYTGRLDVECRQCGLSRKYYMSNLPKWLHRRLAEFGAALTPSKPDLTSQDEQIWDQMEKDAEPINWLP